MPHYSTCVVKKVFLFLAHFRDRDASFLLKIPVSIHLGRHVPFNMSDASFGYAQSTYTKKQDL